ncbi:asparagine synthase (glutamine-hydrolyzing) [Phyllobacterium sp. 22229]|uniref:asparagine synthase (glutamine-hydrolyzing) n=1 Tax=Agrobacterium radiobacter TaxID=362 RepID=A0ABD5LQ54_AGRRD
MCGLTGWLCYRQDLEHHRDVLERMTATMALRGPDETGLWIDGPIALGHRRLSVIDLTNGQQPFIARDRSGSPLAVITYVGEVYNFRELRSELEARGHKFRTCSDTEVVLLSYLEWGEHFVEKLNGMFAFALWDVRTRELYLVRDQMGVKPLYYYETRDGVVFGSEPKALLANPLVSARVTAEGLSEILEFVKNPGRTAYDGMKEVVPGQIIRVGAQGLVSRYYWKLEATEHEHTRDETILHVRGLLEDIMERQLVTDVPLSCLLSGGLDSSTLAALASKRLLSQGQDNIRTFSVDFVDHGAAFVNDGFRVAPDTPFVEILSRHIGSQHQQILIDSQTMATADIRAKIVSALDLPPVLWGDLWPSLYRLFEEVRKHSTVAISGEAADEVFGGYRWFHDPEALRANTFPWLSAATQKVFGGNHLLDKQLIETLNLPQFVQDSYAQALRDVPHRQGESVDERRIREISHLNLTRFVRALLDRKDRMSMAHGLELRVPFCDHRLVQYAFNIPWEMKSFDGREKSILRAAAADLLPLEIIERKKNPYPSTQDPSYERGLRSALSEIVSDHDAPIRPLLDLQQVNETLSTDIGESSNMQKRMGVELVIGLNAWMKDYKVDLAL